MSPSSTSYSLDSEVIFASSYRKGAVKCIGHAKSKSRGCNRSISQANVKEHDNHMVRLNSLPLWERAESQDLEEAAKLLLCRDHKEDLSLELEKARQKFREAASEEARKKEEETEKVCGSVMQLAIVEVLI